MDKLYSVKEIAQMLNDELEAGGNNYRYTEERVRSRLRYLRSKATTEARALQVKPKTMGYDRRAKYYTQEDVDKLRSFWIGPMIAEFHDYPEDIPILEEANNEEVEVREARPDDAAELARLMSEKENPSDHLSHDIAMMLRAKKGVYVAHDVDGKVMGWAQGELSPALSVLTNRTVAIVRLWVATERRDSVIAARSLFLRLQWLLSTQGPQKAEHFIIEAPSALADFLTSLQALSLKPESEIVLLYRGRSS